MTRILCGVDVSKARLDAAIIPAGVHAQFENTGDGIAALAAFCRGHGVELVVMEASGGYERLAFLMLWQEGIAAALTNPRSVRRYAEAMGVLEKTDRLDAGLIARFAIAKGLQASPPPSPGQQRLKARVTRLRQITGDLTVQKQRRATAPDAETVESLDAIIALLKRQERQIEGEIASMIDDDPLWACIAAALRSVKGVAGRTVARILADMPEIGTWSNKAVAKLAGLAPLADDSGTRSGQRHIRAGRAPLRSILFLVADLARRYDQTLAEFHRRLTEKAKPRWSSASRSPENSSSGSMQKHATRASHSPMHLDTPDSRSLPRGGRGARRACGRGDLSCRSGFPLPPRGRGLPALASQAASAAETVRPEG